MTSLCAFFGATTGMISHLNKLGVTASGNWFPTPQSRFVGVMLIGGGALGGWIAGGRIFGNPELQRLAATHD